MVLHLVCKIPITTTISSHLPDLIYNSATFKCDALLVWERPVAAALVLYIWTEIYFVGRRPVSALFRPGPIRLFLPALEDLRSQIICIKIWKWDVCGPKCISIHPSIHWAREGPVALQARQVRCSFPCRIRSSSFTVSCTTIGSRGDCTHPPTLLSIQLSVLPLQELTNLVSCVLVRDMLIRVSL